MKTMRIAVLAQSPDLGGAEQYSYDLIDEWITKGHRVWVVSDGEKYLNLFKDLKVKTIKVPFTLDIIGNYKGLIKTFLLLPFAFLFYLRIFKKLKGQGLDLIFATGFSEKLLVTFIAWILKAPIVWEEYGPLGPVFKKNFYLPKLLYRLLKKIPSFIIVPSDNTKKSLITDARVSLSKIKLIPCGINVKNITGNTTPTPGWENKFIIGNISRLAKEKGQEYLIKAAPLVLEKYPDSRFLIVGDGPDKDYYNNLIKRLGLENKFKITSYVRDVSPYYQIMNLFVFPTVWELEGFGLVAVEAMIHKLPVIASKFGPIPEIVKDGKTGLLTTPENYKKLAKAIIKLMEDKDLKKRLGTAAKKRALKLYDIAKISDQMLSVFRKAVGNKQVKSRY